MRTLLFPILSLCLLTNVLTAQEVSQAELRLRETLKNTLLQLRASESEKSTLLAEKTTLTADKTNLESRVTAFTKQAIADKETNDSLVANLNTQAQQRDKEIVTLRESLVKWKAAYTKTAATGSASETERTKLAARVVVLDRIVADHRTKNAEMYQLGTDILNRYEKFGLGTALTAREPFVGLTRVKFENLIQDYSDKLSDSKIKVESLE